MQVTETTTEGLRREFTIVVPAADIEKSVDTRLEEVRRDLRLPGFRPGKVPMPLVKQRYGNSVIGEVLEGEVNRTSQETITARGLKPALQPKIEITSYKPGTPLEYKMALELLPEFEPADFSKIKLTRQVAEVTEAALQEALDKLAKSRRKTQAVTAKRAAKLGDTLVIDFDGSVDGVRMPGMKAEGTALELGSNSFVDSFEEQLVGVKPNDHRQVTVTFPKNYASPDVAGKTAVFEVDVKELREPAETAMDDEFAKEFGFADFAELQTKVRERMAAEYGQLSRQRAKRVLLDKLAETHDFPVPSGMVEMEFNSIWQRLQEELKAGEQDHEDAGKSEDALKAEYHAIAERRVRLGLLLAEVGRRNKIQVQGEELNRAMYDEARRYPGQEMQVIEYFRKNPQAMESLKAPLYEDKVIDFILELAKVTDETVSLEELQRDPDDDTAGEAVKKAEAKPKKAKAKAQAEEKPTPKKAAKSKAETV